jgi:hypothetical protein
VNRTNNNFREPFGISESWDVWDIQIKQLKKRNDLLADADEMPETGNSSGHTESSPNKESQESG